MKSLLTDKIRFKLFKGALPRCEIEAVWSLFAYFAGTRSLGQHDAGQRWRLVLALLFSRAGVFGSEALRVASDASEPVLAPSRDHLNCCEIEIDYLAAILSVGAMDPLPPTDGLLVKLVENAFALQADEFMYNSRARELLFPPIPTKHDSRSIARLWDETNLQTPFAAMSIEEASFSFSEAEQPGKVASLLPASGILRRCVSLFMLWLQRIPEKKARWSRLNEKILELISKLENKARLIEQKRVATETDKVRDSFEDAFSTSAGTVSKESSLCPELFYREGLVHLLIYLAVARKVFKEPGSASSIIPGAPLTKDLREKVLCYCVL